MGSPGLVHLFHNGQMLETLAHLKTLAVECADTPTWSLPDPHVVDALHTLHQAEQALTAAKLHLIQQLHTRDLPAADHAGSTAGWLREHLHLSTPTARRLVDLARSTDTHPDLDQALSAATINTEQATVIATTLNDLPHQVGAEITAKAETMLIDWATQFDPHALRRLGTRILAHVAPDIAEQADAAALARQEARAHTNRTLSLMPHGDGRVRITGWLDTEAAAIITAALDSLCTPRTTTTTTTATASRSSAAAPNAGDTGTADNTDGAAADSTGSAGGTGSAGSTGSASTVGGVGDTVPPWTPTPDSSDQVRDDRTPGQRRADALTDICRLALNTGELPTNGGDRPQLTLTIPYDLLRHQLGTATLDTGEHLTPTQARKLACDAHLIPAVLGTQGQILDLGQSRRLITGALRRALVLRDRGCTFPGCDRPPRWTEGHHIRSWVDGGPTNLDNSALLCAHHHRVIHHSDWTIRLNHNGHPEYLPPPHLDPHQKPRSNTYHHQP